MYVANANGEWEPEPNILYVPEYVSTTGPEAIEVCELAGLDLDKWQKNVLTHSLGEAANGKWAAFEVVEEIPRQNGKTLGAIARELVGLFLLGERLIIHSAHQFDTSLEAFRYLTFLIEDTPDFDQQVKKISRSHGEEGIELKSGQRIRFRTRTKGGGRGFTSDCLILDEAMILPEATIGALMPTLSARPNPQVWYCLSAVDQEIHDEGIVAARLRERARKGKSGESLFYIGYGLPYDHPDEVPEDVLADPASWRKANPGFGIRISEEHIGREYESMDARTFAVERGGVGDWPNPLEAKLRPLSPAQWATCHTPGSQASDPLALVFDVSPNRRSSSIGIAGYTDDHQTHVEVVDHRPGTDWVALRVKEICDRHNVQTVFTDGVGPGAALIPELEELGVEVETITTTEHAAACGMFYDGVIDQTIHHLDTPELKQAIAGAIKRKLGERWAWDRTSSSVDISPLVAITLANWGLRSTEDAVPQVWSIREAVERKRAEAEESVEVEENELNNDNLEPEPVPAGATVGGPCDQGWIPI